MSSKLTRNQTLVLNVLKNEAKPLSAYAILDRLREEGFRAPLQVYRALEGLVQLKCIHRLESVNAFMVCSHPENCHHELTIFTLCNKCGQVNEIQEQTIAYDIKQMTQKSGFQAHKSTIEVKGTCKKCTTK
ncbi:MULTISPECIES: Fur family transcriptional regulator [Bartonella]|uniref:Transcriptional regulator, Fur family n=1 Tax=Bartonella rochalimae ATCC BAA-1498 TaxID=685782 RepID=E6YN14_9HYPH|nr:MULTISPECIES: Fur family transcriptional regulator [Bartonella]AQX18806.1 transcriptional regulator [Bartonella sp. A1379B]AQX23320.1 Fur family transcriptional regulator, zinc uptake regulator [Bartonella sp. 11B]AQX23336.1 Fur family transcriptional regulator, zinc uptake regulator [Bartonella sp. 11B]AQX23376.1 Fur family transcriptional regulator, zinc uptake regulator [Bartonella sp. 114]AQX24681.1 Fur family transcriptional regulator, zinc uptake regulator [Bartonella sp. 114]